MSMDRDTALAERCYTLADQQRFAALSGDHNPIHVDPLAARRTIGGECIVHGVHGVLWALEQLTLQTGLTLAGFKAKFLKPMLLDDPVTLIWDAQARRLSLRSGATVLVMVSVTPGSAQPAYAVRTEVAATLAAPQCPSFEHCAAAGPRPFVLRGEPTLAAEQFPALCKRYGAAAVNEVAALSQIVGMEQPGLYSLFTALKVQWAERADGPASYAVLRSDERFKLLTMAVQGHALTAEIEAFYRPGPVCNPGIADLALRVRPDEFKGVRALIVGGSRGLGELVAKLISAGGGSTTITYSVGQQEADRVVAEIAAWGGEVTTLPLTVGAGTTLPAALPPFNQLYYFATPRIMAQRAEQFDSKQLQCYLDIYVDAFDALCEAVQARGHACAVFYPSTVFIDSQPTEFKDYVSAKMQGEARCAALNRGGLLQVLAARLPRMATDQTQSFTQGEFDDPVQLMLPWLRRMPILPDTPNTPDQR